MDFSAKLENLQAKVNEMVATSRAAAEENREQLKQRVDQAQDDANQGHGGRQATSRRDRRSGQEQVGPDEGRCCSRREDVKAKINKRADQLDAKAAAKDADWAEQRCSRRHRLRRLDGLRRTAGRAQRAGRPGLRRRTGQHRRHVDQLGCQVGIASLAS